MKKYEIVKEKLIQLIKSGKIVPGEKLPSLTELQDQYNVSKITIVRAFTELQNDGLIFLLQGSGAFVRQPRNPKIPNLLTKNKSYGWHLTDVSNQKYVVKSFEKILAPPNVRKNLNLSKGEYVWKIVRQILSGKKVRSLEVSFYSCTVIPYMNREIISNSIFKYIKQAFKIRIALSDKYVSVGSTTAELSSYLEQPENAPYLIIKEIYYTQNGTPFDFSYNYYPQNQSEFYVPVMRN